VLAIAFQNQHGGVSGGDPRPVGARTFVDVRDWSTFTPSLSAAAGLSFPLIPVGFRFKGELWFNNNNCPQSKPTNPNQKLPALVGDHMRKQWATPLHGIGGASNVLTSRLIQCLTTQVKFENSTKDRFAPINPRFVEFLMGYPEDYTELPA
jgi:hypothetical protein